jgi:formiminotetrahydrofolate cyclodeaminase
VSELPERLRDATVAVTNKVPLRADTPLGVEGIDMTDKGATKTVRSFSGPLASAGSSCNYIVPVLRGSSKVPINYWMPSKFLPSPKRWCEGNLAMIKDDSVQTFLDALASQSATPGGGSAAAIMGAMGAALVSMVCNLTIGKKNYIEVEDEMKTVLRHAEALRQRLTSMINHDVQVFDKVMGAYALPRQTDEEKTVRSEATQAALKEATLVPLACARACGEVMELSKIVAKKGNLNIISDAGVAVLAAHAALRSAALNVYINAGNIKDRVFVESKLAELEQIMRGPGSLDATVYELVKSKLK